MNYIMGLYTYRAYLQGAYSVPLRLLNEFYTFSNAQWRVVE